MCSAMKAGVVFIVLTVLAMSLVVFIDWVTDCVTDCVIDCATDCLGDCVRVGCLSSFCSI